MPTGWVDPVYQDKSYSMCTYIYIYDILLYNIYIYIIRDRAIFGGGKTGKLLNLSNTSAIFGNRNVSKEGGPKLSKKWLGALMAPMF